MIDNAEIWDVVSVLKAGGAIIYPTDTIWGIGCDASNEDAIEKVIKLKKRAPEKGFVLLVDSIETLQEYVPYVPPKIQTLLAHHTRPLTVIYENAVNLPASVLASDGSVAIRIVQDEFCKSIIEILGSPLVSSSANAVGNPFPQHYGDIKRRFADKADYIVKHRRREKTENIPSPIAKLSPKNQLVFLRK